MITAKRLDEVFLNLAWCSEGIGDYYEGSLKPHTDQELLDIIRDLARTRRILKDVYAELNSPGKKLNSADYLNFQVLHDYLGRLKND